MRKLLPILCLMAATPAAARANLFDDYTLQSTFSLDLLNTSQSPSVLANLSDGRIVAVVADEATNSPRVYIESAVGSRSFDFVANLTGVPWNFGGSFMAASPGGAATRRFAMGNGNGTHVAIFTEQQLALAETSNMLTASIYNVPQFSGVWQDDQRLVVNGFVGFSPQVSVLDTNSPTATPSVSTLIGSGLNASAGVAFDSSGNLYVGEGFGAATGEIRKFTSAQVQTAITNSTPLAFGSGQFVSDTLGASPLVFDAEGNLWVGGGDTFDFAFDGTEEDFFALIEAVGTGGFDPNNPNVRTFGTPGVNDGSSSYYITLNDVTGEIYVHQPFDPVDAGGILMFPNFFDVDNQLFQVFAAPSAPQAVPEPAGLACLLIATALAGLSARLTRPRRGHSD